MAAADADTAMVQPAETGTIQTPDGYGQNIDYSGQSGEITETSDDALRQNAGHVSSLL